MGFSTPPRRNTATSGAKADTKTGFFQDEKKLDFSQQTWGLASKNVDVYSKRSVFNQQNADVCGCSKQQTLGLNPKNADLAKQENRETTRVLANQRYVFSQQPLGFGQQKWDLAIFSSQTNFWARINFWADILGDPIVTCTPKGSELCGHLVYDYLWGWSSSIAGIPISPPAEAVNNQFLNSFKVFWNDKPDLMTQYEACLRSLSAPIGAGMFLRAHPCQFPKNNYRVSLSSVFHL